MVRGRRRGWKMVVVWGSARRSRDRVAMMFGMLSERASGEFCVHSARRQFWRGIDGDINCEKCSK